MIAHTDHAVMVLTRSTFTPVFAPRITAVVAGALFARAIVTRAVLAGALIPCTVVTGAILTRSIFPRPIFPRPIFPRTVVAAAVVTATILTAVTAAFGPGPVGLLRLGHDGNFNHWLGGHWLQRCHLSMRLHRALTLVSVAVAAARSTRFIARAVGPV
jgi:hypothetical protein